MSTVTRSRGMSWLSPHRDRGFESILSGRLSAATACGPRPSCGKRTDRVSHKLVGRRRKRAAHTAHKAFFFVTEEGRKRNDYNGTLH
jgi:hypothetical protein